MNELGLSLRVHCILCQMQRRICQLYETKCLEMKKSLHRGTACRRIYRFSSPPPAFSLKSRLPYISQGDVYLLSSDRSISLDFSLVVVCICRQEARFSDDQSQ